MANDTGSNIGNNKQLLQNLKNAAKSLKVASVWATTNDDVDISDDFIFEMFVLFKLIIDIKNHYTIEYVSGNGEKKHAFPKKPANKLDRPFFIIKENNNIICQICAGTRIRDIWDSPKAPDISFQLASSSNNPDYTEVKMIWDAKYRKNPNKRITSHEVSEFGRWLDLLEVKHCTPFLIMNELHRLNGNILITNGKESTEPNSERNRLGIKECSSFYPGKRFNVQP